MQCSAVQFSAVRWSSLQCSAVKCSAVQCSEVQCSAVQCSAVQCSAVQCSTVQCSAVQCSAVQWSSLQCSAVQCSAVFWPCPPANHTSRQIPEFAALTHSTASIAPYCTLLHTYSLQYTVMYFTLLFQSVQHPTCTTLYCTRLHSESEIGCVTVHTVETVQTVWTVQWIIDWVCDYHTIPCVTTILVSCCWSLLLLWLLFAGWWGWVLYCVVLYCIVFYCTMWGGWGMLKMQPGPGPRPQLPTNQAWPCT